MKIAVASDDEKTIASHFGRTRGFLVFEIEDGEIKSREYQLNTFTGHARGLEGAGHALDRHGPILAALADCNAVISHGMGRRIYADLKQAGIEAFIVEETEAEKAVGLYLRGELADKPELGCEHKSSRSCD
jgi:predicted Fe-Mo cluster-binding NifX family protein